MPSLRLIQDYLSDRYKRVETNNSYCLNYGVPEGSILSPTLFEINLCSMFLLVNSVDIASCAYNSTVSKTI